MRERDECASSTCETLIEQFFPPSLPSLLWILSSFDELGENMFAARKNHCNCPLQYPAGKMKSFRLHFVGAVESEVRFPKSTFLLLLPFLLDVLRLMFECFGFVGGNAGRTAAGHLCNMTAKHDAAPRR